MLIFEDDQGLCFWPEERIASITPAFPNRLRVVAADGSLGYCFGPVPPGPWVQSGEGWVQPGLLQNGLDPAGFAHPPSADVLLPGYDPEPYWALEKNTSGLTWHSDSGTMPCPLPLADATRGLCQCGSGWYFQPRRLRRLTLGKGCLIVTFDQGRMLEVTRKWWPGLLRQLGVSELRLLPASLSRTFLREYPFEIARASAQLLGQHFSSARQLIANLIWQALFYRRQGLDRGYGNRHRGFWYNPVCATLSRAGLIELPSELRLSKEGAEALYASILSEMIDDDRLFCYRDLGFVDAYAAYREIGARRPDIILFIEKDCLAVAGIAVARHFGLSWIVSGGVSHLTSAEFFCAALRQVYSGPVTVPVYGDYDPGGWVAGQSFVHHLQRYDVLCPDGPCFLVRPELFSQEELDLFSRPLSSKDGRVDEWLALTGGIAGQARGIHADWLQPPERLLPALQAMLGEGVPHRRTAANPPARAGNHRPNC